MLKIPPRNVSALKKALEREAGEGRKEGRDHCRRDEGHETHLHSESMLGCQICLQNMRQKIRLLACPSQNTRLYENLNFHGSGNSELCIRLEVKGTGGIYR